MQKYIPVELSKNTQDGALATEKRNISHNTFPQPFSPMEGKLQFLNTSSDFMGREDSMVYPYLKS